MGKKYLNIPPITQMISIRLETTAPPSIMADRSVAPRLSNSWCPASLRRCWRRFLTQNCSQKTTGIRARAISRLYSGFSINQPFHSYGQGKLFPLFVLLFLFLHLRIAWNCRKSLPLLQPRKVARRARSHNLLRNSSTTMAVSPDICFCAIEDC